MRISMPSPNYSYFHGMKWCQILSSIIIFSGLYAQTSKNVHLLDHWTDNTIISAQNIRFNEVWYFQRNDREYAIIGSTAGTHFFEIMPDDKLRNVGFIQGDFPSAQVHNRDFRDLGDYVYAVADQGQNSALQIINIAALPDSVYLEKTDSTNWNRVHTICIDYQSALLYACTFTPPQGHPDWFYRPLKVFSLADPLSPSLVFSGFNNIAEVHYAYVRGDTAYLNCGFDGLRIYNFANPSSPVLLGSLTVYNDQGYNHSGWLSEDGKTYYFTDETDGKRIKMVDVSDISNPAIIRTFGTANFQNAVAHHIIPVGDLLYVSYYNEGLRIFDTRAPAKEVAHYDTYPLESNFLMNGAWGVYPFRNGTRVLVSDRSFGLFLFGFDYEIFASTRPDDALVLFPNPITQGSNFTVLLNENYLDELSASVYDAAGNLVATDTFFKQSYAVFNAAWAQGVYHVVLRFKNYLGEEEVRAVKVLVR
jgi:choice-of-anchor B domain-containing protein